MRPILADLAALASVTCAALLAGGSAQAQSWQLLNESIALRSGETVEIGDVYWVVNCRSQLRDPPQVTIMDGPPGVTATVTEARVMARYQHCSKPVPGAKLKITAGEIGDYSHTTMTLRIKYKTRDGDRELSRGFNVTLFP